ncbi:MAG: flagellar biosynthesis anti-sigma factor FlgM [Dehalococcoidales bacterium]|nr:flagellar biosynthesis anti-sigma factor FlgM [Dehalococcoidales bacterium]
MNIDKAGPKAIEAYVQKTQAASEKAPPQAAAEVKKANQQDEVSISKAARELQEAQKAIQSAPDVREAKVAAIKKQLQEGTYNVPAEALVEKLLSVFKSG